MLGGWGLVGTATLRKLVNYEPKEIVILSLKEEEAREACDRMASEAKNVKLVPEWGNIFVNEKLKDLPRDEIIYNPEYRALLLKDVMEQLDDTTLHSSWLFTVISKHKPNIIIDSVNSATGLAYQDIFTGYYNIKEELAEAKAKNELTPKLLVEIDKILATQYIPQIIRHIQILHAAMLQNKTNIYLKIGTTGTGGMGLNIPYTHSEERPSRVLMSKTSLAGAHTMLLFLMSRTPGGPLCKEIKPAAAIAWKGIGYGEIRKHGKPIEIFDCTPDHAFELGKQYDFEGNGKWENLNDTLKSVYIDTGENGIFSRGEFETITAFGQMEFVTPEEIANNLIMEITGDSSGHDVINALENSVMGPTYRAGYMRHQAISEMEKLEDKFDNESVAFEILGPPRLSKLLYEAQILKKTCKTLQNILQKSTAELSDIAEEFIHEDRIIRSEAISVGIPILLKNGKKILRGPNVVIPVKINNDSIPLDNRLLNIWAAAGWIDLREQNMQLWQSRIKNIVDDIKGLPVGDTSSRYSHGIQYWELDESMNIGKLAAWIFINEDKGLRIKR